MRQKLLAVLLVLTLLLAFTMQDAKAQAVAPELPASASEQISLNPLVDYRYKASVIRDSRGNTLRSPRVITAFRKMWSCPVTGSHIGACPGWAIDHVIPLACGGVDAVWNMQWLPDEVKSAAGPFSKDHFERRVYGGNQMSVGCP